MSDEAVSEPGSTQKRNKGKAVYVAKVGNVKVPVYLLSDGRYCIVWRQVAGGSRKRELVPQKKEACERADEVAKAIANSLADVVTLTSADRDSYRLAVQMLAPFGVPLHAAIEEYIAVRKRVAPHSPMEAANYFVRQAVERQAVPATDTILAELLAQLRDERRDERRYIKPLSQDLQKFADVFPDLQDATEDAIRSFLRGLTVKRARRDPETGEMLPAGSPVSARRRDNFRDAIVTLMRFARGKDYLPSDKTTAAERIGRIAEGAEVTTYTPAQVETILNYFASEDPNWLPWAAIQAFAGLRSSEIYRLQWSSVHWDEKVVAVPAKVARKVRTSRKPPILPALAEWLKDFRRATGFVIPRKWKDTEAAHGDALERLRKRLKWDRWENNALRHSFGSHRLAIVKSYEQVALEMGNSPKMVRENYNDPKSEVEAGKYFGLRPSTLRAKVLQFRAIT